MELHKLEKGMALILEGLGVDRKDRNFQDTPERFARAMQEMFEPEEIEFVTFPEEDTDSVMMRDHKMYTLCPHHMLLVKMYVSVAYIPDKRVLGLSKLPRLCAHLNRGPILQETFTKAIVTTLVQRFRAKGAAALVEGHHGCMESRGIKTDGHVITTKFAGTYASDLRLQDQFMALCKTPR